MYRNYRFLGVERARDAQFFSDFLQFSNLRLVLFKLLLNGLLLARASDLTQTCARSSSFFQIKKKVFSISIA